jgi:hypothetical protein
MIPGKPARLDIKSIGGLTGMAQLAGTMICLVLFAFVQIQMFRGTAARRRDGKGAAAVDISSAIAAWSGSLVSSARADCRGPDP